MFDTYILKNISIIILNILHCLFDFLRQSPKQNFKKNHTNKKLKPNPKQIASCGYIDEEEDLHTITEQFKKQFIHDEHEVCIL